ncbi:MULTISPECIES: hypothetical protein [Ensifer]|jgi:hypothetical protein|uniref:hypothetical protein n=1 Tax=Ensifer TaxID=106591 RepID=UPI000A70EC35|nr:MULTISPECIES: hypothetical protein [Ensifer]MBD9491705.1 hypothetical protein [Ensifer sp. ENS11]MDP9633851.1 hypothetical protein [Ensifer adhaerens]UBI77670.1 hypothetical protein J3R84_24205 [Ensifer canadensis]
MSDEIGATKRVESGLVEHLCEHSGCTKWRAFGYVHGSVAPNRYYFEHRIE